MNTYEHIIAGWIGDLALAGSRRRQPAASASGGAGAATATSATAAPGRIRPIANAASAASEQAIIMNR
jgi:hypothetical protein